MLSEIQTTPTIEFEYKDWRKLMKEETRYQIEEIIRNNGMERDDVEITIKVRVQLTPEELEQKRRTDNCGCMLGVGAMTGAVFLIIGIVLSFIILGILRVINKI